MPYTLRHSKISYKDSNNQYQPLDVLSDSGIQQAVQNWLQEHTLPLLIVGTNENGQEATYKLTVVNGQLGINLISDTES